MLSTLLQLRIHVESEKLERAILEQLVQLVQRDFALLQPQIEVLDKPTTSKSPSLMTPEKENKILEKRLSTENCRHTSQLNSLQTQLSTMGDQICQLEHCNSNFILRKISTMKLVFESVKSWCLKPGRGVQGTHSTNLSRFLYCTKNSIFLLLPANETLQ